MAPEAYAKRPGTSGIKGHLYETKLISLILFRARQNDQIEEFNLASNVDQIGAFDDICFRIKFRNSNRPLAVFIQAKHREDTSVVTFKNTNDMTKYFDSYKKIRRAMKTDHTDVLFNGAYDDVDCVFIIYTTSSSDCDNKFESSIASKLNDLICTGGNPFPLFYDDKSVQLLRKIYIEDQMELLGISVASYLRNNEYTKKKTPGGNVHNMFNDELILRYHVILAERVMVISDIQPEGYRLASITEEFIHTNKEFFTTFRKSLFKELLKSKSFSRENSAPLVVTPDNLLNLTNKKYKVPVAFGNKDLTIRGNDSKIERRLELLSSKIGDLLQQCQDNHIICINESLGDGLLRSNGGLGSAVGNLLVLDENSKLMKFTDNPQMLGNLARRLFEKLQMAHADMQKYRFDIKVDNFPKLAFECSAHENDLVKDFTSKCLFYSEQADEELVEEILKGEIEKNKCNFDKNVRVRTDALFLTYHDDIQKWWMSKSGTYLTKQESPDITIKNIITDPLLSVMTIIYQNKMIASDYIFNDNVLTDEETILNSIISSDNCALSVAKVLQIIKNREHYLIDIEYLLQLPIDECYSLSDEITKTKTLLIFICECEYPSKLTKYKKIFDKIAKSVKDKKIIVITIPTCVEKMKNTFSHIHNTIQHEKSNLAELSENSRNIILNSTDVIFQDATVSLSLIIDEVSIQYVAGQVFKEILSQKAVPQLGKSLGNSSYEDMKHLYIPRRVKRGVSEYSRKRLNDDGENDLSMVMMMMMMMDKLKRMSDSEDDANEQEHTNGFSDFVDAVNERKYTNGFSDLSDEVVLITATPGMGKSTFLTHLSLQTKILEPHVWIVRVNLLDHSKEFSIWKENRQNIDILQCLKFLCSLVVSKKIDNMVIELEENNGVFNLKTCTIDDDWIIFELKLFIHFFNTRKLLFIFDGFDEICPHYSKEVLQFLNTVRNYHQNHKIWIASRAYNQIESLLHSEFGASYELLPFSDQDKSNYLKKFWKSSLIITELDSKQLENVFDFITIMKEVIKDSLDTSDRYFGTSEGPMNKLQYLPLYEIYFSALDYFTPQLIDTHNPLWTYKDELEDDLFSLRSLAKLRMRYNGDRNENYTMKRFTTTPLHLYLMAEYFRIQIINPKDVIENSNKWELNVIINIFYELFLETKLKTIRFQEKNKMDVYNPDIANTYAKERADFIANHKKLAAYAIFFPNIENNLLLSEEEVEEIKNMIKLIEKGEEKSGLIYSVASDNRPIFVHRTIAEYFAVEYFCDLMKQEQDTERRENMISFIFNVIFFQCSANVSNILDSKLTDTVLYNILHKHEKYIFDLLMRNTRHENSILEYALTNSLSLILDIFFSVLEIYLNKDNIKEFIHMIVRKNMILTARNVHCYEFIWHALLIPENINMSSRLFSDEEYNQFSFYEFFCKRR